MLRPEILAETYNVNLEIEDDVRWRLSARDFLTSLAGTFSLKNVHWIFSNSDFLIEFT